MRGLWWCVRQWCVKLELLLLVVMMMVCRRGSHKAVGPILQGGTKGTAAWPETPKPASNMLGGNLTPADRHGSVQVMPLFRAAPHTLCSCCRPPTQWSCMADVATRSRFSDSPQKIFPLLVIAIL